MLGALVSEGSRHLSDQQLAVLFLRSSDVLDSVSQVLMPE
jgi:hypothetical protein